MVRSKVKIYEVAGYHRDDHGGVLAAKVMIRGNPRLCRCDSRDPAKGANIHPLLEIAPTAALYAP